MRLRSRRRGRPPGPLPVGVPVPPLVGTAPGGGEAQVGDWAGRSVVVFVTAGCRECAAVWAVLAARTATDADPRLVVVTPGPGLESRRTVTARVVAGAATVVMDDAAWTAWGVAGAPWGVVVDEGRVAATGSLDVDRLRRLLRT